ncbi:hypothetical protein MJM83_32255, partial [Salmonella enterica subsp. enterica serovar Montevideo]|nr:hypothetical protein [Salmonella enterica subsp. enterica serovar Montevideo]
KHIFISNLKYQTLLDSIQGRSPNVALLPLISIPELETWVETWVAQLVFNNRLDAGLTIFFMVVVVVLAVFSIKTALAALKIDKPT